MIYSAFCGGNKMRLKCGEYKHFKGKRYMVYGIATDSKNKEVVLYQQRYGNRSFWIRPVSMFLEKVNDDGQSVRRFSLLNEWSDEDSINELAKIIKQNNQVLLHSETEEKYRILFIDTDDKKIEVIPYKTYSPYLTDSQLAWRMGYDFYRIDNDKYVNPSVLSVPEKQKLIIKLESDSEKQYEDKKIIENLNPCSIDLHISEHFFSKQRHKTIDIASMMHFSVKASELWKKIRLKRINGFDAFLIRPGETIITNTLEYIELPHDCAGKIEIKSTYARLALSVTSSDFCNPGWKGYFPLVLTNNSKHKLVLHPKEKMLQLSLIQTDGNIINEYSQNATYMNDDGTPFKFWHAQTVKHLQKERYSDEILNFYNKILSSINVENSDNPDETKTRFEDTFLLFCEKKLKSEKYNSLRDSKSLLKKLWNKYRRKESTHKLLMSKLFKGLAFVITFIPSVVVAGIELFTNGTLGISIISGLGLSLAIAIAIVIVLHVFTPKCFCTFEKMEFESVYKRK